MDEQHVEPAQESALPAPSSRLGSVVGFVRHHPKTSLVVGAGLSFFAGMELLAAAMLGGAVTLVFRRGGNGVKEGP